MSEHTQHTDSPEAEKSANGFFINAGTNNGSFTTPDGDVYDIRKLEPREVTDPRTGEASIIWGGYATARDRDLAAKDSILQTDFKKTGERPAEFFSAQSRDIPLYVTLRNRPGKGFTDIGTFWNSKGRYTILARDLEGKKGLRFGGNVIEWKSRDALDAERDARAQDASEPNADAARAGAEKRAHKGRDKAPTAEA
jgi:hypothetical protein